MNGFLRRNSTSSRLARALVAVVLPWGLVTPALAVDSAEARANLLHHIAQVNAVVEHCGELKINSPLVAVAMTMFGIKAADISPGGRYYDELLADTQQQLKGVRGLDEAAVCAIGRLLYGPDGQNVNDLVVPK